MKTNLKIILISIASVLFITIYISWLFNNKTQILHKLIIENEKKLRDSLNKKIDSLILERNKIEVEYKELKNDIKNSEISLIDRINKIKLIPNEKPNNYIDVSNDELLFKLQSKITSN